MKQHDSLLPLGATLAIGCFLTVLAQAASSAPAASSDKTSYLRVYTETVAVNDGDIFHYPHTPYTVYRPDGSVAARVDNHAADTDEQVETVELPAGTYRVKGESATEGVVTVSVTTAPGRVTEVHLEKDGAKRP